MSLSNITGLNLKLSAGLWEIFHDSLYKLSQSLIRCPFVSQKYFIYVCFFTLQLVIGSAIQAFEELCPERIDLIHKNYRKLCSLLADVEEWGQIIIINMLTRYARTQFVDPNPEVCYYITAVSSMVKKLFFVL